MLISIGFNVDKSQVTQADKAMDGLKDKASSLGGAMGALGAALGMAFAVKELFAMADGWANVEARIGLVTKGAEDQAQAFDKVYQLSQDTRQSLETTGDLFYKLSNASHEFGASQEDVLRVTETVNKALVAGGAGTQEAKATVLQLGQALASGRLQGDELRSLDENASNLMREVAKNFGVTIGDLKKMGAEGKLTSKEVFEAIKKSSAVIDAQFEKMPTTIGQATTVSMNIVGKFFRDIEKETGVFKGIASGVVWVFTSIDKGIRGIASSVGGFKNLIKLLGLTIMGLGVAFAYIKWGAIMQGITAVRKAMILLAMNPLMWKFVLIAAAVVLVALALEDLYYWITGGESVLGKYLGSWEDFKTKVITWTTDMKNTFFDWLISMFTAFGQWVSSIITGFAQFASSLLTAFAQWVANMIAGFVGFFSNIGQMWDDMKNYAISVLSQIGTAIGTYVLSKLGWAGQAIAKLAGMDFTKGMNVNTNFGMNINPNLDMMGSSRNGGMNITVNQELPPGTPAQQASFVQNATEQAADGLFSQRLVLGMQYGD